MSAWMHGLEKHAAIQSCNHAINKMIFYFTQRLSQTKKERLKEMYEEELKEIKTYQGRVENLRGYL